MRGYVGGGASRCRLVNSGLGSNVSRWLVPPFMNREMTALAFGGKCGFLGKSGDSSGADEARRFSSLRRSQRASPAMPPPSSHRKRRRESGQQAECLSKDITAPEKIQFSKASRERCLGAIRRSATQFLPRDACKRRTNDECDMECGNLSRLSF